MKLKLITLVFLVCSIVGFAQQDAVWNTYMALQENGTSSTNVRMDLKEKAPINGYDFLFYVKIKYKFTSEKEFPTGRKLLKMYRIKDSIRKTVYEFADHYYVGSFMYDGYRYEYYYVKEVADLDTKVRKLFARYYPKEKFKVFHKEDPSWDLYTNFLYPNDEIKNFMSNRDTVIQLEKAGDVSSIERKIDHYATFPSEQHRNQFIAILKKSGFTIHTQRKTSDIKNPYEVKFSKSGKTTLDSLSEVTTKLIQLSKDHNGLYDGWETHVVRKK